MGGLVDTRNVGQPLYISAASYIHVMLLYQSYLVWFWLLIGVMMDFPLLNECVRTCETGGFSFSKSVVVFHSEMLL